MANNDLTDRVLARLRRGRESAITGKELAQYLGERDDRRVRLAIRDLIHSGHPVASAVTGEPKGYFLCQDQEEAQEYCANLTARIREDAARLQDFQRAAQLTGARPGQLSLV